MASTDVFPVDCDYSIQRSLVENLVQAKTKSGVDYAREAGAPQRLFILEFRGRTWTEWNSIWQFYRKLRTKYFIWTDKDDGSRGYPVKFYRAPEHTQRGFSKIDISCQLVEAVNCAPATYPQTPLIDIPVADFVSTSTGKRIVYSGYGYKIWFSGASAIVVDGNSSSPGSSPRTDFSQKLNQHEIEMQPNTCTITQFQFVP